MKPRLLRYACATAVCGSLWTPAHALADGLGSEPRLAGVSLLTRDRADAARVTRWQSRPQNVGEPQQPKTSGAPTGDPPTLPRDYVIGSEDALSIVFWKDPELSAEVVVRPDGKISLPLLKDVQAAGYTPEQLTDVLVQAASKYVARPTAAVIVKAINSRKVYVLGQVSKPGGFPLAGDMNVLQLIALAGGVLEYAHSKDIVVSRKEEGREMRYKFNYNDVVKGKKTDQNILLKPGDTVIVP